LRSEVFDGDSDTIITELHEKNFVSSSYVTLDPKDACGVSSAVGSGSPVGIGDLNIGRNDDLGKYNKFVIKKVFHIPDSPVNIFRS